MYGIKTSNGNRPLVLSYNIIACFANILLPYQSHVFFSPRTISQSCSNSLFDSGCSPLSLRADRTVALDSRPAAGVPPEGRSPTYEPDNALHAWGVCECGPHVATPASPQIHPYFRSYLTFYLIKSFCGHSPLPPVLNPIIIITPTLTHPYIRVHSILRG